MTTDVDSRTLWNWCMKGCGGAVAILERNFAGQMPMTTPQIEMLESLAARLVRLYKLAQQRHRPDDVRPLRTLSEIHRTAGYTAEQTLEQQLRDDPFGIGDD